jgi:hypothetical protein
MNTGTSYNIYFNVYASKTLRFAVAKVVYVSHVILLNNENAKTSYCGYYVIGGFVWLV